MLASRALRTGTNPSAQVDFNAGVGWEQFDLDARVQRIYGGSNEIVKEVISRSL